LEAVKDLEQQKRKVPTSTPEFHAVADEIQVRSRRVFQMATREEELGDEAPTGAEAIDDVAGKEPGR
jgi:hypothetical protein